jgi:hypothetical protein
MTPRHILSLVAVALASVGTAVADPPGQIYVTNGPGGQILAINIDSTTGVQVGAAQTLVSTASTLTDLTQRSDGSLFYATTTEIRRLGTDSQDSAVAGVAGAGELRFSAYDCLFFNRTGGVNSVGCGNTSTPAGAGGSGLAFNVSGQLLAMSGTTVVRIPVDALGNKGTPVVLVSTGLTSPTGIAVAAGLGPNNLSRGDFVVTDGSAVRLYDGKTGALKNPAYASVPLGQTINFADFDADDRLWLAAMTTNGPSSAPNGRIYRVDAAGAVCGDTDAVNCRLVARLPSSRDSFWPAVGLALGPSGRLLTQQIAPTVPNGLQSFKFDFGSSIVEIKAVVLAACQLRVTARTSLGPAATALVNDVQYSLDPYLGDEGLPTVYRIESRNDGGVVDANACVEVTTTSKPLVFVGALTSTETNPRLLRCEPNCAEVELLGWWHTGPIDGDGEGGGRTDDWSDWLIVEKAIAPPASQTQFCGFEPPLRKNGSALFAPGSTFTVRAQFAAPGQPCSSGMFLMDPNAKFVVSLAQIAPVHDKKPFIDPSGGPAIMKFVRNAYDFTLSLNEPNGDDFADGTYEITVTDVTPGATRLPAPAIVRFKIGVNVR